MVLFICVSDDYLQQLINTLLLFWIGNEVLKTEQFLETLIQGTLSSMSTQSWIKKIILWLEVPHFLFMISSLAFYKSDETYGELSDDAHFLYLDSSIHIMFVKYILITKWV